MEKESDREYKRYREEQSRYRRRKERLQGESSEDPGEDVEESPSSDEADRGRGNFLKRFFRS